MPQDDVLGAQITAMAGGNDFGQFWDYIRTETNALCKGYGASAWQTNLSLLHYGLEAPCIPSGTSTDRSTQGFELLSNSFHMFSFFTGRDRSVGQP